MRNYLLCSACIFALAACSGGGGSVDDFSGFSELPDDGTVRIEGRALTAPYTANLATGEVSIGAVTSDSSATVLVTRVGGITTGIAIRDTDANVDVDLNAGAAAVDLGNIILISSADGTELAAIADDGALGFEYQSFGAWLNGFNTGSGAAGVGTFGLETDASNMPSGTVATYNGNTTGLLTTGTVTALTTSDLQIQTDFNNVTVSTSNTEGWNVNTAAYLGTEPNLDLTGSGTISGSGFTGSVASALTSGDIDGQFYGPNAEEVGGTFATGGSTAVYVGTFGGSR